MKTLETFEQDGQSYEIRCWHDEMQQEWVARAFVNGRPVEGLMYTCSDETFSDLPSGAYKDIVVRSIRGDIVEDRWGQIKRAFAMAN